jgi:hypothetical protein
MRKLILLFFIFILFGVSACNSNNTMQTPTMTEKFISEDSTLVFTFVVNGGINDSIYVDTYESGCGLESYQVKIESEMSSITHVTHYWTDEPIDGTEDEHDIYLIRSGNHWENNKYKIRFGNGEFIPIVRLDGT